MPPYKDGQTDRARQIGNNGLPFSNKDGRRRGSARYTRQHSKQTTDITESSGSQQLKANELKKKLRDLIRLMRHKQDMSAGERQYKQRELAALRRDLEDVLYLKERRDMISKYHMVRFFERRKAERHLKQAQKRASVASADSTEREALKSAVHEAEVDLNYTLYSPLEQKYLSLYDNKKKAMPERGAGFKSAGWRKVEEAMIQQTLHELRDRQDCLSVVKARVDILIGKSSDNKTEQEFSDHHKSKEIEEGSISDEGFFFES